MAKCKLCKKLITDGTEYCIDCADKKDLIANESYLDDLLNSVQNNATSASDIYKKKKDNQNVDFSDAIEPPKEDLSSFIDLEDLGDFDSYDFMKEFEDPIIISDEELYEDEATIPDTYIEDEATIPDTYIEEEIKKDTLTLHNIDNEFLDMNESDEQSIVEDDEHIEPILEDLLKQLDLENENDNSEDKVNSEDNDLVHSNIPPSEIDEDYIEEDKSVSEKDEIGLLYENELDNIEDNDIAPENELMELLNQFNPSNPIDDDIQAISELLGGISEHNQPMKEYPEDVGEVFSEALEAVSDLEDPNQGIQYLAQDLDPTEKKRDTKVKKEKKVGLFTKLFANIDDEDLAPEEKSAQKEAAAAKEAKKNQKKAKSKKNQITDKAADDEVPDRRRRNEEPEAEDSKKEKKPKKEKKKKIVILDDEVDEGHINKTGASIVFLFFGILVMLLLITTNIFSYSLSIKNATDYFKRQRYNQAYNEVYGIELKDEDIELYDKIMTVMFVNKQLNSYNNYYHMRKFPEALDSLLKGLQRYDKYIELATMLGINTDLDYVRNQIIAELYNVFSLTEEQALSIINSESQAKYSISVYDVILENVSFYN